MISFDVHSVALGQSLTVFGKTGFRFEKVPQRRHLISMVLAIACVAALNKRARQRGQRIDSTTQFYPFMMTPPVTQVAGWPEVPAGFRSWMFRHPVRGGETPLPPPLFTDYRRCKMALE